MVDAWLARRVLSATSAGLLLISYITCISIAIGKDTYIGGLPFPYFSDTGRDKPAYYVFATLNTVSSILMIPFMILQFFFINKWLTNGEVTCRNYTATIAGAIAPIGSALLSIFDTSRYSAIHSYSAYIFFILIVIHAIISITIYRVLSIKFPETFKKITIVRYVLTTIFFLAFLCYIPIGLGLICDWTRLTMADCISFTGDKDYCESKVKADDPSLTILFNYDGCPEVNTMRSATQFVCIVSVLILIGLYSADPYPPQTKVKDNQEYNSVK